MLEHLPDMHKVLGSIPGTTHKMKRNKRIEPVDKWDGKTEWGRYPPIKGALTIEGQARKNRSSRGRRRYKGGNERDFTTAEDTALKK